MKENKKQIVNAYALLVRDQHADISNQNIISFNTKSSITTN